MAVQRYDSMTLRPLIQTLRLYKTMTFTPIPPYNCKTLSNDSKHYDLMTSQLFCSTKNNDLVELFFIVAIHL